jgi:hypothetical protein
MFQSLTHWFSELLSILLGVYHSVSGGPTISRWLHTATPPMPDQGIIANRLGLELGRYLAIAIRLTFVVLGSRLLSTCYLFWAIAFFIIGGLSVSSFQSCHVSRLVWLLTILLSAYYFYGTSCSTSREGLYRDSL